MNAAQFRKELTTIMPGYAWTVHRTRIPGCLNATGTQSSGFNRLSTLSVTRRERDGEITYETKSAGYGLRAPWLHTTTGATLARALRSLQDHYEAAASNYSTHAGAMKRGRNAEITCGLTSRAGQ